MPVALVRIDDRLVHGQVVEGWLKVLGLGRFKRHRITPDIGMLEATKL